MRGAASILPRALALAAEVHQGQTRADGTTAYLSHPIAVAALVLRFGGDEDQAAAALVHDAIGDPRGSITALTAALGPEVARIAHGFADPPEAETAAAAAAAANGGVPAPIRSAASAAFDPWRATREAYLGKLRTLDERTLLVVACEELHEGDDLLLDIRARGAAAWKRFPVHSMVVFWYFREVLAIVNSKITDPRYRLCVTEYAAMVKGLQSICFE